MVQVEQPPQANMTYDEASMERSKSFVKALQELKNLRPQLYSAAEYCEKSYLFSEQKQMVLDNLKDYAVRALVNAVDHLGTVAFKLNDHLEQQSSEISTMGLNISYLNQKLLTCRTYTDKEGLRQQRLMAVIPRHHKHYVLPNSVNKKVHFSPLVQSDVRQNHSVRSRLQPSGAPAAKTLSWHLASETKSTLKSLVLKSTEDQKNSAKSPAVFHLAGKTENTLTTSSGVLAQLSSSGGHTSNAVIQTFGAPNMEMSENFKPLTAFRSFDTPRRDVESTATWSRSILSSFFVKHKTSKQKTDTVL